MSDRAAIFAVITEAQRARYLWCKGMSALERREANRELYGLLQMLPGLPLTALAKGLGVSAERVYNLRQAPPTEQQIAETAKARAAARLRSDRRYRERMLARRERQRRRRDNAEQRETATLALLCLIDAYTAMGEADYYPNHHDVGTYP